MGISFRAGRIGFLGRLAVAWLRLVEPLPAGGDPRLLFRLRKSSVLNQAAAGPQEAALPASLLWRRLVLPPAVLLGLGGVLGCTVRQTIPTTSRPLPPAPQTRFTLGGLSFRR